MCDFVNVSNESAGVSAEAKARFEPFRSPGRTSGKRTTRGGNMTAGNERTSARRRFGFVRRAAIGVGVALAGMGVAAIPASAASQDGTSNTIQFSVASATLDQAHHRVIVTSPSPSGLAAGQHLAMAEI